MEESKKISLKTGDVSLNPDLGVYYIDMRPAIIHYTNNIWGGIFDKQGVPMCMLSNNKLDYFPINIAQYGFILHANWLQNRSKEIFDTLIKCVERLDQLKIEDENTCVWYHTHFEVKYKIKPPWASAMAQGECISLYLRVYQATGDTKYLNTAIKSFNYLKINVDEGGVRRYDEKGNLWFEEYPSKPPSYVLNGFIYTLFGLYDLYRVTNKNDTWEDILLCHKTLIENLHLFDVGYWSSYDLQKKELVRYYYQKNVHVPQLKVLYLLTNEKLYLKYYKRWMKTVNPINYLFVQIMYRIQPRVKSIKHLFNQK